MARTGRKRKPGPRTRAGRLNVRRVSDDELMAMQPHRRYLPIEHRLSTKAVSLLGRLHLLGCYSEALYEAGAEYARIVNRYRAVVGAIDPLRQDHPGFGLDLSPEDAKRRTEVYNDAYCALGRVGQRPAKAVKEVAVYDRGLPIGTSLDDLVWGLKALARHLGLTGRTVSLKRRNA